MNRLDKFEYQLLVDNGFIKIVKITKQEYDQLKETNPDQVFMQNESIDEYASYYQYIIEKSYTQEDVEKIIKYTNVKSLLQIKQDIHLVKNIVLVSFVVSIIGAIILILMRL